VVLAVALTQVEVEVLVVTGLLLELLVEGLVLNQVLPWLLAQTTQ
jgi:hypothetical protein